MASPPTRTEFRRSRFYQIALAYNKRNETRLKHIQDLLEKTDEKKKRSSKPRTEKRTNVTWVIPDGDNIAGGNYKSREDRAVLAADKSRCEWIFNGKDEYTLSLGEFTVMKLPKVIHDRLKPFQRDALKWFAGVSSTGGILADDMGECTTGIHVISSKL